MCQGLSGVAPHLRCRRFVRGSPADTDSSESPGSRISATGGGCLPDTSRVVRRFALVSSCPDKSGPGRRALARRRPGHPLKPAQGRREYGVKLGNHSAPPLFTPRKRLSRGARTSSTSLYLRKIQRLTYSASGSVLPRAALPSGGVLSVEMERVGVHLTQHDAKCLSASGLDRETCRRPDEACCGKTTRRAHPSSALC